MKRINKKGFLASTLVDFYAYITFVLVLIIFYSLFTFGGEDITQEIKSQSEDMITQTAIMNYLRTPYSADIDGDGVQDTLDMGDIIALYAVGNEEYREMIEDSFQEIINLNRTVPAFHVSISCGEETLIEIPKIGGGITLTAISELPLFVPGRECMIVNSNIK